MITSRMAAALLLAGLLTTTMQAQQTPRDPRWEPWLGCWSGAQADSTVPLTALCVIPTAGTSAVDIVQIADLQVVARKHIEADGERHATTHDDCTGWDRAEWSAEGRRLYLRSEQDCAGEPHRVMTAIMAMTSEGRWLSVESANEGARPTVRVQRYDAAPADLAMPEEVVMALADVPADRHAARLAAVAPIGPGDVIAANGRVDIIVLETWLSLAAGPVQFSGRQLVLLADSGVAPSTIDLLVALANPRVFAVATQQPASERIGGAGTYSSAFQPSPYGRDRFADPDSALRCSAYSGQWMIVPMEYRFERGRCGGYLYGRGYGWYDNQPMVQVVSGGGSSAPPPKGRAINGRGYTQGRQSDSTRPPDTNSGSGQSSGAGSQAAGATPGGYSGGSTTTPAPATSTERTAHPRP